MECLGFQIKSENGKLPTKKEFGSFILTFSSTIHPLRPQSLYSLMDRSEINIHSTQPQLISYSLAGPYSNELYVLVDAKYYSNQLKDYVTVNKTNPNRKAILKKMENVLGQQILLLEGDFDQDFSVKGMYQY